MRIADIVLRRGHLSENALVDAWYSGVHPAHLDRCDLCAERARAVSRWLDDTRRLGLDAADDAFPAERLAAQQHQILARLEQLDRPAKLLAFPRTPAASTGGPAVQQVSPRWLVAAAAAGLVLGVVGGRLSMWQPAAPPMRAAAPVAVAPPAPASATAGDEFLYDGEISAPSISSLRALDTLTPPVTVARVSTSRR